MEILESIKEFIRPELLILVPVLYFIGMVCKSSQRMSDRAIPALLGGLGIGLAAVWVSATGTYGGWRDVLGAAFMAITQGILCAGTSVYINQLVKQARKTEKGGGGKDDVDAA